MKQTRETRELVAFITAQTGDDLVISFAVCKPDDPTDIESLTILRTPKYEAFLDEWERGASVSFDRDLECDERALLREVVYASDDKCITLRTAQHTFKLNAIVRSLFETTVQRYGRVDLLFNNAGTGAPSVDIDALELEAWNKVLAVNLTGAFLCTREAFRVMRQQRPQGCRIFNNGSISAHAPRPRSIAYTAT